MKNNDVLFADFTLFLRKILDEKIISLTLLVTTLSLFNDTFLA